MKAHALNMLMMSNTLTMNAKVHTLMKMEKFTAGGTMKLQDQTLNTLITLVKAMHGTLMAIVGIGIMNQKEV